jgi:hypothetical protein
VQVSMTGKRHTEETKRRISEAMRRPLDEDLQVLGSVGQTTTWEFAERIGCSEQMARNRLNRLVAAGHAEKFMGRGSRSHTYVVTVKPGDVQIVTG